MMLFRNNTLLTETNNNYTTRLNVYPVQILCWLDIFLPVYILVIKLTVQIYIPYIKEMVKLKIKREDYFLI